jgi:hypothetical protein
MSSTINIKCDLCNHDLKDNEMQTKASLINIGQPKPKSKYNLSYTFDSVKKSGDLCLSCSRKIRDYIEDLKEGKK